MAVMLTRKEHEQLREKVILQMPPFPENVQRDRPIPGCMFLGGMIAAGVLCLEFLFLVVYQGMTR